MTTSRQHQTLHRLVFLAGPLPLGLTPAVNLPATIEADADRELSVASRTSLRAEDALKRGDAALKPAAWRLPI